jgi:hypothetical protein
MTPVASALERVGDPERACASVIEGKREVRFLAE